MSARLYRREEPGQLDSEVAAALEALQRKLAVQANVLAWGAVQLVQRLERLAGATEDDPADAVAEQGRVIDQALEVIEHAVQVAQRVREPGCRQLEADQGGPW